MALLLSRTHYSLLTAPSSPQALCEEAVRLGLSHLVLNDTNGLYGLYPSGWLQPKWRTLKS